MMPETSAALGRLRASLAWFLIVVALRLYPKAAGELVDMTMTALLAARDDETRAA